MTFSMKTLLISAVLFAASLMAVGSMYLPLFEGKNGFQTMETAFNSLRKGVRPPFKKLTEENEINLGRNFRTTMVFRSNEKARIATMIFLANKLTVTPKGRSVNIQGDLGYTLQFFMDDISLLYANRFDLIEKKYSMPYMQSMYMLDRILKKMSPALAALNLSRQEKLVRDIRGKLLVPAYNLREALPVGQTSGFFYLTFGTIGILIFAIFWDISNYMFFGTLVSENFLNPLRVKLGLELSDEEKAAIKKKEELLKKKRAKMEAAKKARAKKKAEELLKTREGKRTNKEALKKQTDPEQNKDKAKPAARKTGKKKSDPEKVSTKKKTAANSPKQASKKAVNKTSSAADKKTAAPLRTATKKKNVAADKKQEMQNRSVAVKKQIPKKKNTTDSTSSGDATPKKVRQVKKTAEKPSPETSQNNSKKVTTRKVSKTNGTAKREKATPDIQQKQSGKTGKTRPKPEAKEQDKN